MSKNKKTYTLLIRLLGPLIFLFIVLYYIDLEKLKLILSLVRYDYFLLSALIVPIIIAIRSARWQRILTVFNIQQTVWDCFRYIFVEMVAISVVSAAGTLIKVFYLRGNGHRLLLSTLAVVTDKVFDYMLPLLFGLFSFFVFTVHLNPNLGLIALLVATGVMYKPLQVLNIRILPRLIPASLKQKMAAKNWHFEQRHQQIVRALDFPAYTLSVAGFLLYFLCVHMLNLGLGIDLGYSQMILVMSITSLIAALPISFLGIGTRDIALIAVFSWFDRSAEQAVSLSLALLLLRLVIMLMGSFFWYIDPPPFSAMKEGK